MIFAIILVYFMVNDYIGYDGTIGFSTLAFIELMVELNMAYALIVR